MDNTMKISVIGVGNAGGQAAVEAYYEEFPTYLINSSVKDLNTVTDDIHSFVLGQGRGCGKDRDISKAFYKQSAGKIFENKYFQATIEDANIIVIVGSSAGGTGSGTIPTLAYNLMTTYPDKTVTVVGYIPKYEESAQAQFNCIEFIDELENLKIPYSLLDAGTMENEEQVVVHKALADGFVERIKVMRGDYFYESTNDMIDESDSMSIFTQPGLWVISSLNRISQDSIDNGQLQKKMIETFKKDINVPIQKDKKISRMGVVFNSNGEVEENSVKTGIYTELSQTFGEAPAVFTHNGNIDSTESQMILIMSGLSMPYDRLMKCKEVVERVSKHNTSKKTITEDKKKLGEFMKSSIAQRAKVLGADLSSGESVDLSDIPDFLQ